MNNKAKLDLIRSLKIGDVVIAGYHVGAIRYLGPLEGNESYNTVTNNIYALYAGIELTEPIGHMDGTMTINGKTITYFETPYGDNINKQSKLKPDSTQNPLNEDEDIDGKYGLLIPAVSIQKKIDSFTLLKKITLVFEQYKSIKKQLNQKEQTFIDIKTNSDLQSHSPPTTYNGISTQNIMPISQEPIIANTIKKSKNQRKNWSLTPMPSSRTLRQPDGLSLRKMHSDPYSYNTRQRHSDRLHTHNLSDLAEDDSDFPSITLNDKKPLNSTLPPPSGPMRVRLIRGYSYDQYRANMATKTAIINERSRTCSYNEIHRINHDPNRKIKMVLSTAKDKDNKDKKDNNKADKAKNVNCNSPISVRSNNKGHHVSASMYTHGPLNVWTDSNRYLSNKLTSSGGGIDKNVDLSSLAIATHVSTRSASFKESPHQMRDSDQLKELLEELKREKLNDIVISSKSDNDGSDSLPKLMNNLTTAATVDSSETNGVLGNNYNLISISSPEEKLAEVENNEDEKQLLMSPNPTIQTPVPNEIEIIGFNLNNLNEISMEAINEINEMDSNKKRSSLNLTEHSLRKHNKRRSKIILLMKDNEHRHQQTLSEPMLPKFNLMLHGDSSDDDAKSGSSDGEDEDGSEGMDNNLDTTEDDHTLDITEDDVQLNEDKVKEEPKGVLWSMASPISRRSSVNDIDYKPFKTKHEYLRDITYFNTQHRAQRIDEIYQKLKENLLKEEDPLDIIKEEEKNNGHQTQLSSDTRYAVHESLEIEPYLPPQKEPTITIKKQQSINQISAMV